MGSLRVLVVEDGYEYAELLGRFLPPAFELERAGSGPEALEAVARGSFDVILLDMRFDRTADELLLGDREALLARMGGDPRRVVEHLQVHQGAYILAALREAGCRLPVVISYDFDREPRRWAHLRAHRAPVTYLRDDARPEEVARHLARAASGR